MAVIPIKPNIPPDLKKTVERLDMQSTLILQGILLDHALKLVGLQPKPTPKPVIQL